MTVIVHINCHIILASSNPFAWIADEGFGLPDAATACLGHKKAGLSEVLVSYGR